MSERRFQYAENCIAYGCGFRGVLRETLEQCKLRAFLFYLTNGDCQPGDSGAPFYTLDGESAVYCGVLHGEGSHLGYSYVYFTPYTYMSNVGFSIWASED